MIIWRGKMTERVRLLESIAKTIADYRNGEIPQPSAEHVEKWVGQFQDDVQEPILREMDYVLDKIYFNKKWVVDFLRTLVKNEELAGKNPLEFWKKANFLNIQQHGNSQNEMLDVLSRGLQAECKISLGDCGQKGGPYFYLDDALFSGFRVGDDLSEWIQNRAPDNCDIHILMIALYSYGYYRTKKRLDEEVNKSKKKINFHYWRAVEFENSLNRSKTSEVLWPAIIPDDEGLKAYMAKEEKFPFIPREPGGKLENKIFSSEEGRQLLERELLLAGVRIRSFCKKPKNIMRPLGFSPFGLGFGSLIVTFRNCPNNCPLALWWGDPETNDTSPLSKWYPLFPRKTYEQEIDFGISI
jgi:hypothetical protein